MSLLSQVACTQCREGEPPVSNEEVAMLHPLVPAWKMVEEEGRRKLRHSFPFEDGRVRQAFLQRLEKIGLEEKHSIEVESEGNTVHVTIWTPLVEGLHPNDFIMAAKAEGAFIFVKVGAEGTMSTDERLPQLADLPRFGKVFARRVSWGPGKPEAGDPGRRLFSRAPQGGRRRVPGGIRSGARRPEPRLE